MSDIYNSMIIGSGRQDCSDMHSYGPGVRVINIIHYIIRGRGRFTCNGKTFNIETGHSFVIRPYDQISYYPDPKDPWEYTWICFSDPKHQALLDSIGYESGNCVIGYIAPEKVMPYYSAACEAVRYADRHCVSVGLALTIIGIYADAFPAPTDIKANDLYFESACSMIFSNYHKPDFSLNSICSALCISRATLHRCFIKAGCKSPGAYLIDYRLKCAKKLLELGSTVKSTAYSCGFKDPLYFSKAFSAAFGVSPQRYRSGIKSGDISTDQ